MFDFQKLDVYQKSKVFNKAIIRLLVGKRFDRVVNDQLRRASLSIMLNIAESSSRFSNKDRKNLLVISRGSAFECAAIMEFLYETNELEQKEYEEFTSSLEEISRMIFALIRKLE
ncbi:MAG: four helix bundle protein [Bacteroidetes bacterium RBG_13_42_15]|nr:MAG: four helix bundle protein [Bacteroidetes bacterium RBG_13_42_15]